MQIEAKTREKKEFEQEKMVDLGFYLQAAGSRITLGVLRCHYMCHLVALEYWSGNLHPSEYAGRTQITLGVI